MTNLSRKPAGAPGSTGGQFDGRGARTAAGGTLTLDEFDSQEDLLAAWEEKQNTEARSRTEGKLLEQFGSLMNDTRFADDLRNFEKLQTERDSSVYTYSREHADLGKKLAKNALISAGHTPLRLEYDMEETFVVTDKGRFNVFGGSITSDENLAKVIGHGLTPWINNQYVRVGRGRNEIGL